jgi:hypothetical protein
MEMMTKPKAIAIPISVEMSTELLLFGFDLKPGNEIKPLNAGVRLKTE